MPLVGEALTNKKPGFLHRVSPYPSLVMINIGFISKLSYFGR
jgi:hypothetical protein